MQDLQEEEETANPLAGLLTEKDSSEQTAEPEAESVDGRLPPGWVQKEHQGRVYYVHPATRKKTWERPQTEADKAAKGRAKKAAPAGLGVASTRAECGAFSDPVSCPLS